MAAVLILEADIRLVRLCEFALNQDGHLTSIVTDGNSALSQMRHAMPEVIVVDTELLPDAESFWRSFRDMEDRPLLLVIAPFDARGIQERLGAEASLIKPFDPTELSRMVEELPQKWWAHKDPHEEAR